VESRQMCGLVRVRPPEVWLAAAAPCQHENNMANNGFEKSCCVVGGGPAGIMLGYLLARAGAPVTVLEKHTDFNRDFRGDTVHPSTMDVLDELGLLDEFLRIPHQQVVEVRGTYGDLAFKGPDFRHVPARSKFAALMPQWDFLQFLVERATRFPAFDLRMGHEAVDLIHEDGRIGGVVARDLQGHGVEVRAGLTIGCDGRHSAVRSAAQLELVESGVPVDVLWFRVSRQPSDPEQLLGIVNYGKGLVLINRNDYYQAGLIVRKGSFDEIRSRGLEAFRRGVAELAPYLEGRMGEVRSWDQVKLLTVQINRLRRWYRPGLLCIGDAAHAMSPAGGVGINLAIQDAVAAANILTDPLLEGRVAEDDLAAVQKRREFPTRLTQAAQVFVHKGFERAFDHPGPLKAPPLMRLAVHLPGIHRALAYAVGIGVRPEHVRGIRLETRRRHTIARIALGVVAGAAAAIVLLSRPRARRVTTPSLASTR
jgi:2-polyprenyl-6-methoxyphenol hydroxylase-like FAD-dependent oxidoreductase